MTGPLRSTLLALAVGLGLVGVAVLLTPTLHTLLMDLGWVGPEHFLKVLRRLLLIPLLLALFLWLRPWRDGGLRTYGLWGEAARPGAGVRAFGVTLLVLLGLLVWHFQVGWLRWEDPLDVGAGIRRVVRWIGVGLFLATIEEWFFRGWLDRRIGRRLSPIRTALLVAVIYAVVHAFKPSRLDVEVTHDVAGAFQALGWWLSYLVDLEAFGPKLLGLFLFSLLLTATWRRTRSLWVPIGIHAAGVWVLRSYGAFTDRAPQRTWAGTKELFDGPPAWILLGVALWFAVHRRPAPSDPDDRASHGL